MLFGCVCVSCRTTKISDVWALCVTFWELFTDGKEPYGEVPTNDMVFNRLLEGNLFFIENSNAYNDSLNFSGKIAGNLVYLKITK